MGLGLNVFVDLGGLALTAAKEVSAGILNWASSWVGLGWDGMGWLGTDCIQRGMPACFTHIWDWGWVGFGLDWFEVWRLYQSRFFGTDFTNRQR